VPVAADRLNVNGGAIALGHHRRATGARIGHAAARARTPGARRGLATLCVSGGMGMALAVERIGWINAHSSDPRRWHRRRNDRRGGEGDSCGRRRVRAACDLERRSWGADHYLQTGVTMPANGYAMLRDQFDAIFIGALATARARQPARPRHPASARASSSTSTSTTGR
jgi:hypothetical protein